MSLREINHQIAIELGHRDTEFVTALKDERDLLQEELSTRTIFLTVFGDESEEPRIAKIKKRLARIEELLAK